MTEEQKKDEQKKDAVSEGKLEYFPIHGGDVPIANEKKSDYPSVGGRVIFKKLTR